MRGVGELSATKVTPARWAISSKVMGPGAEAAAARRRPAPAAREAGRIEVERNLQIIVTAA